MKLASVRTALVAPMTWSSVPSNDSPPPDPVPTQLGPFAFGVVPL